MRGQRGLIACSVLTGGAFILEHGLALPVFFNVHAFCMLLAVSVLLPLVTSSLWTADPTHGSKKRQAHAKTAYSLLVLVGLAMVGILLHKYNLEKPLLSFSMHASAGWAILAAFTVQGFSGHRKLLSMEQSGLRMYRWHGLSGAALSVCAYGVLALGLLKMLSSTAAVAAALAGCVIPAVYNATLFIRRYYTVRMTSVYTSVPAFDDAPPDTV